MKSPEGGGTPDFCVRSMAVERMKGWCGSVDTGTSGRALMIPVISAISVDNTSWVRQLFCCKSIESRILLATPIIRSHEPPMLEACGGLKFQLHPCLLRYLCTVLSISNFLLPPMKLVPQSDWSCLTGPLRAKKCLRAFIQLDASIDSISSMWTALELN